MHNKAAAVINTLTSVTRPVPKRFIILSLKTLEITVPPAAIIEITPANESGTFNVSYMTGHAEPSRESGSPRLIKEMYMTISNNVLD